MPIIIEFVGAGGVGKSHICREILKKELNSDCYGVIIANQHKVSVIHIFGYSIAHLQNMIMLVIFLRRLKGKTFKRKTTIFIGIIIYLVRRDYLFQNKKIILFDQGIM